MAVAKVVFALESDQIYLLYLGSISEKSMALTLRGFAVVTN
jgi:hypothetical protein